MTTLKVGAIEHPTSGSLATINGMSPSNRNLIINGAMQVAQRGTTSTSFGYGTLDRWKDASSGGGITQSQQALTTGDPYNEGFRNFYRLANTTGTTGAGDTREINTNLEAQDIANSGWQYTSSTSYLTLSFWVRASVTQTYYGTLRTNDSAVYDYGFSFALTADTWTKVTKTIPGNSNLVFNDDNGQGLKIALVPFYGTNYTDSGYTLDTWAATSASSQLPDFTTTWASTNGATFDFTGVQLEVGSVATPFEHRSYGDELARCQRYYQRITADTDNDVLCVGYSEGTTSSRGTVFLRTTMRAAPSAIDTTGTASDYEVRNGSLNINITSITIDRTTPDTVSCNFNVSSGLTSATANLVRFRLANSYLGMSAEL